MIIIFVHNFYTFILLANKLITTVFTGDLITYLLFFLIICPLLPSMKEHILLGISFCCILYRTHNLEVPNIVRNYNFYNDGAWYDRLSPMLGHHGLKEHILMSYILRLR